jgi:hypothetical protein
MGNDCLGLTSRRCIGAGILRADRSRRTLHGKRLPDRRIPTELCTVSRHLLPARRCPLPYFQIPRSNPDRRRCDPRYGTFRPISGMPPAVEHYPSARGYARNGLCEPRREIHCEESTCVTSRDSLSISVLAPPESHTPEQVALHPPKAPRGGVYM